MIFIRFIVLLLVIVGALNWGLQGAFDYDLVAYIAGGSTTSLARFIYILVGLAGIWAIGFFGCVCKEHNCCKNNDHQDN